MWAPQWRGRVFACLRVALQMPPLRRTSQHGGGAQQPGAGALAPQRLGCARRGSGREHASGCGDALCTGVSAVAAAATAAGSRRPWGPHGARLCRHPGGQARRVHARRAGARRQQLRVALLQAYPAPRRAASAGAARARLQNPFPRSSSSARRTHAPGPPPAAPLFAAAARDRAAPRRDAARQLRAARGGTHAAARPGGPRDESGRRRACKQDAGTAQAPLRRQLGGRARARACTRWAPRTPTRGEQRGAAARPWRGVERGARARRQFCWTCVGR
jgi:hypothetical protein